MSNVYMLGSGYTGCNYLRIRMPAYNNGFNTDKKSLRSKSDDFSQIRQDLMKADVVVFHRPETESFHALADMLKADGKKIVMDNDDTFYIDGNHPLADLTPDAEYVSLKERLNSTNKFIKKADLVTTTTKVLAEEYSKLSDNVKILPNCIDPDDWDEPLRTTGNKVRIGIVGSAAFDYDYLHIKDLIRELGDRDDVELVLFGLGDKEHRKKNKLVNKVFAKEYEFWDSVNKEHFPWTPIYDYPAKLNEARLDIMLIPRRENYFNTCKSNVKFLEASMCEIPVIAQSFKNAPYEEITEDMGVLVKGEWKEEVERLIKDKELRRSMGKKAREYAIKNYNINDKAILWENAYKQLYD